MAAKIYWKDARFRLNADDWTRKEMDTSLMKLKDVPFPGEIPNFSCCPYGTFMAFDVEGKHIVLPSDYRNEDNSRFPEYDNVFSLLKHKITTNGVFAGAKPYVAEALRRNERCFFLVADEREPCSSMDQHKRKVVKFEIIAPPDIKESEFVVYDVLLSGNWVRVVGRGKRGLTRVYANMAVPADTPAYAEALYGIFENGVVLNQFVKNAGAKQRMDVQLTLSELIEKNHDVLDIILTKRLSDLSNIEWAVRTMAEHPKFKERHPEIDLELLVA